MAPKFSQQRLVLNKSPSAKNLKGSNNNQQQKNNTTNASPAKQSHDHDDSDEEEKKKKHHHHETSSSDNDQDSKEGTGTTDSEDITTNEGSRDSDFDDGESLTTDDSSASGSDGSSNATKRLRRSFLPWGLTMTQVMISIILVPIVFLIAYTALPLDRARLANDFVSHHSQLIQDLTRVTVSLEDERRYTNLELMLLKYHALTSAEKTTLHEAFSSFYTWAEQYGKSNNNATNSASNTTNSSSSGTSLLIETAFRNELIAARESISTYFRSARKHLIETADTVTRQEIFWRLDQLESSLERYRQRYSDQKHLASGFEFRKLYFDESEELVAVTPRILKDPRVTNVEVALLVRFSAVLKIQNSFSMLRDTGIAMLSGQEHAIRTQRYRNLEIFKACQREIEKEVRFLKTASVDGDRDRETLVKWQNSQEYARLANLISNINYVFDVNGFDDILAENMTTTTASIVLPSFESWFSTTADFLVVYSGVALDNLNFIVAAEQLKHEALAEGLKMMGAIIAVILATSIVTYLNRKEQARIELAINNTRTLARAVRKFVPKNQLSAMGVRSIVDVEAGMAVEVAKVMLFAGIRDFVELSSGMPNMDLFEWLQNFVAKMSNVTKAEKGYVDKFTGDSIFSIFNDPEDGVRASLQMQIATDKMNLQLVSENENDNLVAIGIGLHFAVCAAGCFGSSSRLTATIVSSEVNLASRLEALTKSFGSRIIASEMIVSRIQAERYCLRRLGPVQVSGSKKAIIIYDIFQCDSKAVRKYKEDTLEEFENAVREAENNPMKSIEIFERLARLARGQFGLKDKASELRFGSALISPSQRVLEFEKTGHTRSPEKMNLNIPDGENIMNGNNNNNNNNAAGGAILGSRSPAQNSLSNIPGFDGGGGAMMMMTNKQVHAAVAAAAQGRSPSSKSLEVGGINNQNMNNNNNNNNNMNNQFSANQQHDGSGGSGGLASRQSSGSGRSGFMGQSGGGGGFGVPGRGMTAEDAAEAALSATPFNSPSSAESQKQVLQITSPNTLGPSISNPQGSDVHGSRVMNNVNHNNNSSNVNEPGSPQGLLAHGKVISFGQIPMYQSGYYDSRKPSYREIGNPQSPNKNNPNNQSQNHQDYYYPHQQQQQQQQQQNADRLAHIIDAPHIESQYDAIGMVRSGAASSAPNNNSNSTNSSQQSRNPHHSRIGGVSTSLKDGQQSNNNQQNLNNTGGSINNNDQQQHQRRRSSGSPIDSSNFKRRASVTFELGDDGNRQQQNQAEHFEEGLPGAIADSNDENHHQQQQRSSPQQHSSNIIKIETVTGSYNNINNNRTSSHGSGDNHQSNNFTGVVDQASYRTTAVTSPSNQQSQQILSPSRTIINPQRQQQQQQLLPPEVYHYNSQNQQQFDHNSSTQNSNNGLGSGESGAATIAPPERDVSLSFAGPGQGRDTTMAHDEHNNIINNNNNNNTQARGSSGSHSGGQSSGQQFLSALNRNGSTHGSYNNLDRNSSNNTNNTNHNNTNNNIPGKHMIKAVDGQVDSDDDEMRVIEKQQQRNGSAVVTYVDPSSGSSNSNNPRIINTAKTAVHEDSPRNSSTNNNNNIIASPPRMQHVKYPRGESQEERDQQFQQQEQQQLPDQDIVTRSITSIDDQILDHYTSNIINNNAVGGVTLNTNNSEQGSVQFPGLVQQPQLPTRRGMMIVAGGSTTDTVTNQNNTQDTLRDSLTSQNVPQNPIFFHNNNNNVLQGLNQHGFVFNMIPPTPNNPSMNRPQTQQQQSVLSNNAAATSSNDSVTNNNNNDNDGKAVPRFIHRRKQ